MEHLPRHERCECSGDVWPQEGSEAVSASAWSGRGLKGVVFFHSPFLRRTSDCVVSETEFALQSVSLSLNLSLSLIIITIIIIIKSPFCHQN